MEDNRAARHQEGDQGGDRREVVQDEAMEDDSSDRGSEAAEDDSSDQGSEAAEDDFSDQGSETSDDATVPGEPLVPERFVNDIPSRMTLTDHERNLAINIKAAITANPEINAVSDYMCAQLALIEGDNLEGALARVTHLQCVREEYKIMDTAEDGARCFADYINLFPKLHLYFTFSEDEDTYVMVFDNTNFDFSQVKSEEDLRCWLGGIYYTCAAASPDFESIRKGLIFIAECWKKGFDFKSLKKVWTEVAAVYPFRVGKAKYYNAGTVMTVVLSMMKPFLPKDMRPRLQVGFRSEQRLDSLYLVPTLEEANLRLLGRLGENLRLRYRNERTFRL
jgi:hypothetical protein